MKGQQEAGINQMIVLGIVLTVIIAGTLSVVSSLSTEYSKTPSLQGINKSVELGDRISETYSQMTDESNNEAYYLGSELVLGAKFIWNYITIMLSIPDSFISIMTDFGDAVGVPPIFIAALSLLILVAVIVSALKILTKSG